MNSIMNNNHILYTTLLALSMAGCAQEGNVPDDTEQSYTVGFTTSIVPITRVAPDATIFENDEAFGVLAYNCDPGTNDFHLPNLLYNARVEKYTSDGEAGYRYIPTANWPADGTKVVFAAYYPHNATVADEAIIVSPSYDAGLPEYIVQLGKEPANLDFATAEVGPIYRTFTAVEPTNNTTNYLWDPYGSPPRKTNYVNFKFKRHMSYLSFRAKTNLPSNYSLFLNAIFIRNMCTKATYGNNATGEGTPRGWKNHSTVDGITGATLNISDIVPPVGNTMEDIIDPSKPDHQLETVVMLPQKVETLELHIVYTLEYQKSEGGCEYFIVGNRYARFAVNWQEGKHYVYDLEFDFEEITGSSATLNLIVTPWIGKEINTDMN